MSAYDMRKKLEINGAMAFSSPVQQKRAVQLTTLVIFASKLCSSIIILNNTDGVGICPRALEQQTIIVYIRNVSCSEHSNPEAVYN